MKKLYIYALTFTFCLITFVALAQKTTPVDKRNISGILRDSLNKPISGATVKLLSPKDTMQTSTNQFGFYGFKEVRSAEFLLSIHALGYGPYNRKYFNNDTKAQLNIPPIRLGVKEEEIEAVTIERLKGPLVKGDTTEFWAKDYIVRDYARLEDLLRRMEGITIDPDGSVFYNGERVVKALFNNAQYFKGSVQEAMKELPADIVERIQIIDRNEAGTGAKTMKDEQSAKVMNIVTKADKSAGRMYDISLEQGTQSRSKVDGYMRWIDGTNQTSLSAGYKQLLEGIKSDPVPGSIGKGTVSRGIVVVEGPSLVTEGQRKETSASFGKNIKIGEVFSMYPQYNFTYNDRWSGTQTLSENFYEEGTIGSINDRHRTAYEQKHAVSGSYNLKGKKGGAIMGNLSMDYNKYTNNDRTSSQRSGLINSLEDEVSRKTGNSLNYRFNLDYRKSLSKTWSMTIMANSNFTGDQGEEDLRTDAYADGIRNILPDSTVHQLRNTANTSFRNSISNMFIWAPNDKLKVQYRLGLNSNSSLRDIQSKLLEGDNPALEANLNNYQKNNLFSIPLVVQPEYTFANGIYLSPSVELGNSWLSGKLNLGTANMERFDALWKPRMAIGYTHKKIGSIQIGYGTTYQQPGIAQLNPDAYYSSPYDVQIGNPELKNTQSTGADLRYSKFFNTIGFNVSIMSNFNTQRNLVTSDRHLEIDSGAGVVKTTTYFVNLDGGKRQSHYINLTKTIKGMNSTLTYSSNIMNNENPYLANGKQELRKSLMHQHTLSFFYSPVKWLDITPELRYRGNEDRNTLATSGGKTFNNLFYGELKLGFYLSKDFAINTNLSQSVWETTNIMSNTRPFVLNGNIEKRVFKQKNGIISLVVMDAARQNAFTSYTSSDFGYTNTLTNLDSRYFLLQFSWQPQIWGKSKHDTGKGRRGDGSFVK